MDEKPRVIVTSDPSHLGLEDMPVTPVGIDVDWKPIPQHCPNLNCGGDGFLRDGPWGANQECPECDQFADLSHSIFSNLVTGTFAPVSDQQKAEFRRVAELRASLLVARDYGVKEERERVGKIDLTKMTAEIDDMKKQLQSIQPEERQMAGARFFQLMGDVALASSQKSKEGAQWLWKKVMSPVGKIQAWLEPKLLRLSYHMKVNRSGFRAGCYELVVVYEPSSIGKILKCKEIRQGYRKTACDGWQPYPFGKAWETKPVEKSMENFLERRFLSDRLIYLAKTVDKVQNG